jgi:lyso-ornithine lipid O-acyltransferase
MRAFFRSAGILLVTLFCVGMIELTSPFVSRTRLIAVRWLWMRRCGRAVLRLMGARLSTPLARGAFLSGRDSQGRGRIFAMNHRSTLDIFVYLSLMEANALSRSDLAHWPVIGLAARRVGTLFVDRSDRASGSAAVTTMIRALSEGKGILVFPEGTTFTVDEVQPFRKGAFVAAERARAEVVPVGIAYRPSEACYGDEDFLSHWKRLASLPSVQVAVEFGDPLAPVGDPNLLRTRAQQAVQELVLRARKRIQESGGHSLS